MNHFCQCPHCKVDQPYESEQFGSEAHCSACTCSFIRVPHPTSEIAWFVEVEATEYGPIAHSELKRWVVENPFPDDARVRPAEVDTWMLASRLQVNVT